MSVSPVIAIGLDAADPILVEQWMSEGRLPVLSRLRQSGTYARLANFEVLPRRGCVHLVLDRVHILADRTMGYVQVLSRFVCRRRTAGV